MFGKSRLLIIVICVICSTVVFPKNSPWKLIPGKKGGKYTLTSHGEKSFLLHLVRKENNKQASAMAAFMLNEPAPKDGLVVVGCNPGTVYPVIIQVLVSIKRDGTSKLLFGPKITISGKEKKYYVFDLKSIFHINNGEWINNFRISVNVSKAPVKSETKVLFENVGIISKNEFYIERTAHIIFFPKGLKVENNKKNSKNKKSKKKKINSVSKSITTNKEESNNNTFISDWLISGPYPSYVIDERDTGLDIDYLGGEKDITPYPGLKQNSVFKIDESKLIVALDVVNEWGIRHEQKFDASWNVHHFEKASRIMVNEIFLPIKDHFAFYAACYVESPVARTVKLRLGVDDEHKLYVNKELVGKAYSSQAVRPDTFIYKATLKRGINLILLKVVDRLFDSGFCLAITGMDDAPMDDLNFYLDSPARKLGVDTYNNKFGLKLDFGKTILYDDEDQELSLRFVAPDKNTYSLLFDKKTQSVKNGARVRFPLNLKKGRNKLTFTVFNKAKKSIAELNYNVMLYSRRELKTKREEAQNRLGEINQEIVKLNQEMGKNKKLLEQAKMELEKARQTAEKKYENMRLDAIKKNTKKSIDLPFIPGKPLRTKLLINGWFKAGKSREKLDRRVRLPKEMFGEYFRTRYAPVLPANPKNRFDKNWRPYPGYEKHAFDDIVHAKKAYFEQDFIAHNLNASYFFICENIIGKIKLYCNAELSGEYEGKVGIVEIPLRHIKQGKNTILIEFSKTSTLHHANNYGILGDLYIESRNPVHTSDVWIKTSWRKALLNLTTIIENPLNQACSYQLKQYIIHNGRIKFKLPEKQGTLNPRSSSKVIISDRWANPILWDLKNPYLYTLISDLYCNGKLVDRKSDTFGFREFWVHGVDFFFNGKRIIIQGDTGINNFRYTKFCDVVFPLLRTDGINTIRLHDSQSATLSSVAQAADMYGMFVYAQFYPDIDSKRSLKNKTLQKYNTVNNYKKSDLHTYNLEEYTRWHKTFRNHPSVIIWSVDNELYTPGCYSLGIEKRNVLIDNITALYQKHMQELDPDLIVTRDGDVCTYDSSHANFDPTTPANVHYPEFHHDKFVNNWQDLFEYRPVIYGETLYCSFVWGGGRGAQPDIVASKARRVREVGKKFRKIGIPAIIYMGVGLDGFLELKADGSGSPWKVIEVPRGKKRSAHWRNGVKKDEYPYLAITYPADSGKGLHPPYSCNDITWFGFRGINWACPDYISHVRNAINDAYRDTLIPQPPLKKADNAEAVIVTFPDAQVYTVLSDGSSYGVKADNKGRAWIKLDKPGVYPIAINGKVKNIEFKSRSSYASKPGFNKVPVIYLKGGKK
jgi:Glycosyl hydrolases family 2/Glycosyl hydrolases family 2, TIM barrel domain